MTPASLATPPSVLARRILAAAGRPAPSPAVPAGTGVRFVTPVESGENRRMVEAPQETPRAGAAGGAPAQAATDAARDVAPSVLYEYPLNERVRTLLRLEHLFSRLDLFAAREHPSDHHAALVTLFEIMEVGSRADLKSDLLQELERQRQTLLSSLDDPQLAGLDAGRVLTEIDDTRQQLGAVAGKSGQHLRDNEWLMSIRSRIGIPGGTCQFDLPSYHAWQHRPADARRADIASWTAPFNPLRDGLRIMLRLLRENGQPAPQVARQGGHQQMLAGRQVQMLQIRVPEGTAAIPEISANRYMLWIRFTAPGGDSRPRPHEGDVPFELTLCNF